MDHKEQHHEHHRKEREHEKAVQKQHDHAVQRAERKGGGLPFHPAWLVVLGAVLVLVSMGIYIIMF